MSEFVGPLTDDIELLADDAPAPEISDSTPSAELTQPSEATQPEETATPATPESSTVQAPADEEWMKPLLANKQYGQQLKAAKDRLSEFERTFGTVADARAFKGMLSQAGGIEGIKRIRADVEAVDSIDTVAFGYAGPEKQMEWLQGFRERSEQHAPGQFATMVKTGLDLIKQHSPQAYREVSAPLVGQTLKENHAWEFLEEIYKRAKASGQTEVCDGLNQVAYIFSKYGVGPSEPALSPERMQQLTDFNASIGAEIRSQLDAEIAAQLQNIDPNLNGATAEISQRAHDIIELAMRSSPSFGFQVKNILRYGATRRAGDRIRDLALRKAEAVFPRALRLAVREYELRRQSEAASSKQVKPAKKADTQLPLGRDEAKGISIQKILDSTRPVNLKASAVPRAKKLSKQEASQMTFRQVIEDEREVGENE